MIGFTDVSRPSRRKLIHMGMILVGSSALAACASTTTPPATQASAPTSAQASAAPAASAPKSVATPVTAPTQAAAAPTTAPATSVVTPTPVAIPATAANVSEPKPTSLNMMWGGTQASISAVLPTLQSKLGLAIQADVLPYSGLQQKAFAELAAGSSHYDILYIDTPWMPALASKVQRLSEYIRNDSLQDLFKLDLQDFILKVFYDTSVYNPSKSYSHFPDSTAPLDIDNITRQGFDVMGLPTSSNALVLAYRKDLFEDPIEQSAYKSRYGTDLKAPETWDEFVNVAKFFTRPTKRLWGTKLMAGSGWGASPRPQA